MKASPPTWKPVQNTVTATTGQLKFIIEIDKFPVKESKEKVSDYLKEESSKLSNILPNCERNAFLESIDINKEWKNLILYLTKHL